MVYSNSKRAAYISSLVNSNQGGGNKKPGLWPQVGRDSWTSVYYGEKPGSCFSLACIRPSRGKNPCFTRPVGSLVVNPRFLC